MQKREKKGCRKLDGRGEKVMNEMNSALTGGKRATGSELRYYPHFVLCSILVNQNMEKRTVEWEMCE